MKSIRKYSWYDGWIYAKVIDSDNFELRNLLLKFIKPNKTIIDIGCGTGGFSLKLAQFSQYILAIDISEKQIKQAIKQRIRSRLTNIDFLSLDAAHLDGNINTTFDYAVLSFVIHEIPNHLRKNILHSVRKVARNIVILDYQAPQPKNIWGLSSNVIEFIAGGDHYKNYKDYIKRGGLLEILNELGQKPVARQVNKKGIFQVVLL